MKYKLVGILSALTLVACTNSATVANGSNNTAVSVPDIVVANPKYPLHLATSERCIADPNKNGVPESVGGVLVATLAQHAITTSFGAIKTWAVNKATVDTKAKTFSTTRPLFFYESSIDIENDDPINPIVLKNTKKLSCLTLYVPGDKHSQDFDAWISYVSNKAKIICTGCNDELKTELLGLAITATPQVLYQLKIEEAGDGVHAIYKPELLFYGQRLGVSKSSKDMDLSFIVEMLNPADGKALSQFAVNFKDLKPGTLYLREQLTSSEQKAVLLPAPQKVIADIIASTSKINSDYNALVAKHKHEVDKYKKFCEGTEKEDPKVCKKIENDRALNRLQLDRQESLKTEFVDDFSVKAGEKGFIASNLMNVKASVSEVGDVSQFWNAVAGALGALEAPVKEYAQERYNKLSGNTQEQEIADAKTEIDLSIALQALRKANVDLAGEVAGTTTYFDKSKACFEALNLAVEASIKAATAIPADIDISCTR